MPLASYKFGEFELDCDRYELRRNGRTLRLERIPMDLLILLAEKDGHVVSRQEIIERLWGKDVFVDTEHGINTAIRKIRTALREDAERPQFIQTVQGKGYRLVTEGKQGNAGATAISEVKPLTPAQASPAPAVTAKRSAWLRSAAGLTAVVIAAAILLGFDVGGLRTRVLGGNRSAQIQSIAVLPLANLSGDASQDYFADGMTDELITALAKNRSLRVVSRTSMMQYKSVRRPLPDIARELGVDGILEGSVERSGDRVHMTVQLIHAASDTHVWAETYDRDFSATFSLASELSQTIAKEIKIATSPAIPPRFISPEAHDAYLHARFFWFSGKPERSQEYFEQAIRIQPDYAAAWSGLADAYLARGVGMLSPPQEVMGAAEAAARKAVALDDSLAEVHTSLAGAYLFGDWDWKRAEAEAVRAIALNPNDAEAHPLRAYILCAMNRPEEALQEQKRSTELDSVTRPWELGKILIHQRQFDAAVNELRLRAEAQPDDWYIQFLLADAYRFKGMEKESARATEQGFVLQGDQKSADAVHQAFASGGEKAVAEWLLNHTKTIASKAYVSPLVLAHQTARLSRKKEALKLLEDSYREHAPWLVLLQNEPEFDFLHSEERYRALVKKMGLPPTY